MRYPAASGANIGILTHSVVRWRLGTCLHMRMAGRKYFREILLRQGRQVFWRNRSLDLIRSQTIFLPATID